MAGLCVRTHVERDSGPRRPAGWCAGWWLRELQGGPGGPARHQCTLAFSFQNNWHICEVAAENVRLHPENDKGRLVLTSGRVWSTLPRLLEAALLVGE